MDQNKKDLIIDAVECLRGAYGEGKPRTSLIFSTLTLDCLLAAYNSQLTVRDSLFDPPVNHEQVLEKSGKHPEVLFPYLAEAYKKDIYKKVENDFLSPICNFSIGDQIFFTISFDAFGRYTPFSLWVEEKIRARLQELSDMGAAIRIEEERRYGKPTLLAFQDGAICVRNFEILRNWCLETFSVTPKAIEIKEDRIASMTVIAPISAYTPTVDTSYLPEFLSPKEIEIMDNSVSVLTNSLEVLFAGNDSQKIDRSAIRLAMEKIEDIAGVCGPIMESMEHREASGLSKYHEQIDKELRVIAAKRITPDAADLKYGLEVCLDSIANALGFTLEEISFQEIMKTTFVLVPNLFSPDDNLVKISGNDDPSGFEIYNTKKNIEAITAYIRKWIPSTEEPTVAVKEGHITRMEFNFSNPLDLMRIMEAPISDQNNDE